MGEQVIPTGVLRSWTTMPSTPSSAAAPEEPAVWTLWQHWTAPVLHWLAGGAFGVGVAAARIAKETATASFENIVKDLRALNDWWGVFD